MALNLLKDPALIDAIASVEHDQWLEWAQAVEPEVAPERRERWQHHYVPFVLLPDAVKEQTACTLAGFWPRSR